MTCKFLQLHVSAHLPNCELLCLAIKPPSNRPHAPQHTHLSTPVGTGWRVVTDVRTCYDAPDGSKAVQHLPVAVRTLNCFSHQTSLAFVTDTPGMRQR